MEGFLPIKFLMWGPWPCSVVIVVWLLGEENMGGGHDDLGSISYLSTLQIYQDSAKVYKIAYALVLFRT